MRIPATSRRWSGPLRCAARGRRGASPDPSTPRTGTPADRAVRRLRRVGGRRRRGGGQRPAHPGRPLPDPGPAGRSRLDRGDRAPPPVRRLPGQAGHHAGRPDRRRRDRRGTTAGALAAGDPALRELDPAQRPTLWPEHFDVGITVDRVNYGVSPGDAAIAVPYAYVGPWEVPTGEFWDQPFGAALPLTDPVDAAAIGEFFRQGRARAC